MRYCCNQAAFHCEVSGIRPPRVACRREPIAMGSKLGIADVYGTNDPQLVGGLGGRAHAREAAICDRHSTRQPDIGPGKPYSGALRNLPGGNGAPSTAAQRARPGVRRRQPRLRQGRYRTADRAVRLRTAPAPKPRARQSPDVGARGNQYTLLSSDCLPEYFGQNTPLVYFAERYASLTEVGTLLATFRAKEITPTLKLEQMAMAIYASKAAGGDTFAEAAAAESAESAKPPGGTVPSLPGVPPGAPSDPNTETRAAAVGYLAIGCIALGSNTSGPGDGTAQPSGVPVPPTTPTVATAVSPVPGNTVQAKAMEVDAADEATTP